MGKFSKCYFKPLYSFLGCTDLIGNFAEVYHVYTLTNGFMVVASSQITSIYERCNLGVLSIFKNDSQKAITRLRIAI